MKKLNLKAEKRKIFGRKVKKLRKIGVLPANLYGKDIKSQALKLDKKNFLEIFKQAGETNVVSLQIKNQKKTQPILLHNLQIHPVTSEPLHVDFHKIDLTKKVQVNIPIELKGEAPGVSKGGILVQVLNEIEVEALPADLPDKFEVDVGGLKDIGNTVLVKDLKVDKKKVELLVEDENQVVVNMEAPKEEKEEEVKEPGAEEVEEKTEESEEKKEEEKEKPVKKDNKNAEKESKQGKKEKK